MCADAEWYDGNVSDRCSAGCESVYLCGSVTVKTPLLERRRSELTPSQQRDANYVLSLLFSCSHHMQGNNLRLTPSAMHIIMPVFEYLVAWSSFLALQRLDVVCLMVWVELDSEATTVYRLISYSVAWY